MYIYLAFALVGGFLLANQNPINADLRKIVGSPFWPLEFPTLLVRFF